jgi:hypothetical protein
MCAGHQMEHTLNNVFNLLYQQNAHYYYLRMRVKHIAATRSGTKHTIFREQSMYLVGTINSIH